MREWLISLGITTLSLVGIVAGAFIFYVIISLLFSLPSTYFCVVIGIIIVICVTMAVHQARKDMRAGRRTDRLGPR